MRKLKELKLNGVVVGKYLGSDDQDEDIELAREFLKARGLYNPPSQIMAMLGQANSFAFTTNRIYEQDLMRDQTRNPLGFAPFVVNAAFSVELYLKTLHAVAGNPVRGHKLLTLHDTLDSARQAELASDALRLAPEHGEGPQVKFRDLVTMLNNSFEQWRYFYEISRGGYIHLQQTILTVHTCRDVCWRVVHSLT